MNAISSAMPRIMSRVLPSCRDSPSSVLRIRSADTSSRPWWVVIHGPNGQKVSKPFARAHWPSDFCRSRAVTSLAMV